MIKGRTNITKKGCSKLRFEFELRIGTEFGKGLPTFPEQRGRGTRIFFDQIALLVTYYLKSHN